MSTERIREGDGQMRAETEKMISQVRQTRQEADRLIGAVRECRRAWLEFCDAWKAVMSQAREVRAESRNHRHIALLRRALAQKRR